MSDEPKKYTGSIEQEDEGYIRKIPEKMVEDMDIRVGDTYRMTYDPIKKIIFVEFLTRENGDLIR